ncbi:hypothetical protein SPFM1_00252 [Salmonella phage SPFM1]|nr:hypothetical protein SPFM1_00252 [Salmonella phage SPFM1]
MTDYEEVYFDSLHLYRIDPSKCSEPWQQAYGGNELLLKSNGYWNNISMQDSRTNRSSAPGQPIASVRVQQPTLEAYATRAEAVKAGIEYALLSASQIDRDLYGDRIGTDTRESSSTAPRVLWVMLPYHWKALSF